MSTSVTLWHIWGEGEQSGVRVEVDEVFPDAPDQARAIAQYAMESLVSMLGEPVEDPDTPTNPTEQPPPA